MKITRIDRHEFNIYLSRGELSLIRSSIAERMSNLRRKAANCTACGMEAAELRWLLEEIDKTMRNQSGRTAMYEQYRIEFDWYFGINNGKGKSLAEDYLTDTVKYLQERVMNTSLPTAERYEVQEMVNGLFNLRNAIRDAEEIEPRQEERGE